MVSFVPIIYFGGLKGSFQKLLDIEICMFPSPRALP